MRLGSASSKRICKSESSLPFTSLGRNRKALSSACLQLWTNRCKASSSYATSASTWMPWCVHLWGRKQLRSKDLSIPAWKNSSKGSTSFSHWLWGFMAITSPMYLANRSGFHVHGFVQGCTWRWRRIFSRGTHTHRKPCTFSVAHLIPQGHLSNLCVMTALPICRDAGIGGTDLCQASQSLRFTRSFSFLEDEI